MKKQRRKRRVSKRRRKYSGREKQRYAARLRQQMTPAEVCLWKVLKQPWVQCRALFLPQKVVCGYIPDFVEPYKKLIVEVDGPIHKYLRKRDALRTQHLNAAGYRVLRVTNQQVFDNTMKVVYWILDRC